MLNKKARRSRDGSIGDWIKQELRLKTTNNFGLGSDMGLSGSTGGEEEDVLQSFVQWTTSDDKAFFPASKSVKELNPGIYEIKTRADGSIYFGKVPATTEGLIKFPETTSQMVVNEIEKFWNKEASFKQHKLAFKRGLLLFGPPGSGKTCTIKLAVQDIIKRRGVVVKFCHPSIFTEGMRIFREIQPKTPVIVLMEDIDAIVENFNESDVVNVLDGVDMIERVVFIATTNYPEKLCGRILNRPSRFDKRFLIGMPNQESRRIYLKSLMDKKLLANIETWVKDTEGFSIAHLKELFVAVSILENDYKNALDTLRTMMEEKLSSDSYGGKMNL